MRAALFLLTLLAGLGACRMDPTGEQEKTAATASPASSVDGLAARDPSPGEVPDPASTDDQPRPVMQLQAVLDRLGFTPGVIDGELGLSTRNAISGFQEANGLPITGEPDPAVRQALAKWKNIPATRLVTVPPEFAAGPFGAIPDDPAQQAKLPALGYRSLDEKLAERFHTTVDTLLMLNSQVQASSPASAPASNAGSPTGAASSPALTAHFRAGQEIRVPNVGADRIEAGAVSDMAWRNTLSMLGVGSAQPKAERLVVSKSKGTLKVFDQAGKLVGMYTATMGSRHDPLPLGQWKVTGVAYNPPFVFNPDLFWDVPDTREKQRLPPGPNGPVGVVWIDINKPHYGIHGTPEPETIGRAQSHGCVRLTNWDAARLAQMVKPGVQVIFEA